MTRSRARARARSGSGSLALALLTAACSGGSPAPATPSPSPTPPPTAAHVPDAGPPPADRPPGFADDCFTLARDADAWYPVSSFATDDERTFVSHLVRHHVGVECTYRADTFADRSCFAAARDVDAERACVEALGVDLFPKDRDPIAYLTADMRALDADPSCDAAAAAYYTHFEWWVNPSPSLTGSGPFDLEAEQGYTPNAMREYTDAEQATLIADTRAAFANECADQGWSASVRRCLRAGGHERCLLGIDGSPARPRRWTAPPLDRVTTFVPACDDYLAAAAALADCPHDLEIDLQVSRAVDIAGQVARTKKPKKVDADVGKTCAKLHAALTDLAASRCPR